MTIVAITRDVSPRVDRCQLTHLSREKIDVALAVEQHESYRERLTEAGCEVVRLPGDPELPDCVFVEDTAIVLDELAILTRPGAASRRGEIPAVRAALEPYRRIMEIREPGMLDGGDVLTVGRTLYVGRSSRSNDPGIEQLALLVEPFGYAVQPVEFHSCLHLTSAVTAVAEGTLLVQTDWVSTASFDGLDTIPVHPSEPHGGNALRVGDAVIYPTGYQRTLTRMQERGLDVRTVDQSELAKAEGGVTCGSLIFEREAP